MEPAGSGVLESAELEGERVLVRPVRAEDAEAAFPLVHGRDPILRWLIWPGPESVEELASAYRSWRRGAPQGAVYRFAIVERESGAFAGSISVDFGEHPGTGDLGYWLAERHWGRGFTTEAVGLLCHLCFEHLGVPLLSARVFDGNLASARVLERNGFTREHESPARLHGADTLQHHYAIARRAWRARPDAAQPRRAEVRASAV